jgi:hypothetical protein
MLLLLALNVMGCAETSTVIAPPPAPPRIPALPPQAWQPAMPSICLLTCSHGLTIERTNWRQSLTLPHAAGSSCERAYDALMARQVSRNP